MLVCKGIKFDDWSEADESDFGEVVEVWAEMCESCRQKYADVLDKELDIGAAQGCCSVYGCSNQADHYIDFDMRLAVID